MKDQPIKASDTKEDWKLNWQEDFSAPRLNLESWNTVLGAGGYGNRELQFYTDHPENLFIKDGILHLRALDLAACGNYGNFPKDIRYTSAKITTQHKVFWTYGRFEIKARMPKGQGLWPAFWFMPEDHKEKHGPWPSCGEIDFVEYLGQNPSRIFGTLHYGLPWRYTGKSFESADVDYSKDFHTFTLDWLPGEFRWYVDDVLYQVQKDWYAVHKEKAFDWPAPFDKPFFLQCNLAVGGNLPGNPDATTPFPQTLEIASIQAYEAVKALELKPRRSENTDRKENSGMHYAEGGLYQGG